VREFAVFFPKIIDLTLGRLTRHVSIVRRYIDTIAPIYHHGQDLGNKDAPYCSVACASLGAISEVNAPAQHGAVLPRVGALKE
jgi:hypothetical protein